MTNPELININELKRLLVEVVTDILDTRNLGMSPNEQYQQKRRLIRQIETAILDGDDS